MTLFEKGYKYSQTAERRGSGHKQFASNLTGYDLGADGMQMAATRARIR
jgi:hypothetical protein